MKSKKKYTLIYDQGKYDDVDLQIEYDTLENLEKLIEKKKLTFDRYAIIDGYPIKTFANKVWSPN